MFATIGELERGVIADPTLPSLASRVHEYRNETARRQVDELQEAKREKGDYLGTSEEEEEYRAEMARFDEAPVYEIKISVRKIGHIDKEGRFQEE